MRNISVGLSFLAFLVAAPAFAETKTVQAFCEVPDKKVVTNVVSVTINVDTSSGDHHRIAKSMSEKIGYKASETLYAMGINPDGGIYCRFSDPALPYFVNENKQLDYLVTIPAEWVTKLGYRLVTVSGFGGQQAAATSKVAAHPTSGAPRKLPDAASAVPTVKGPTPNQLKYQRELADYNARLAEIEKIKVNSAAKHAADTAAAEAELARHRRELSVADTARRKYEQDLAAHKQLVRDMETKKDREAKVDWREAVVVCILDPADGQSRFGNWRCDGPLQMTYAKLGGPGVAPSTQSLVPLSQACGGAREAVRDLGMVGDAHVFGCSYGIHPQLKGNFPLDAAAKHGISYVPGRAIYRCPTYKSGCRTQ